ncbi:eukaryotic translation initiation factor 3 subunit G-domain-containing protein [Coniochaeta sp. 2T2.1]|nr:eukaryotic translation initiation factor 3 subunit G-domain-containing protein [Coniochaeta sp. 2T2.1]
MAGVEKKHDWADDEDLDETVQELPPPQKITNKDGSTTVIEYRYNDNGQKVKTTRRIRLITHKEVVNPRVAERKSWSKFGASAKDVNGPAHDTTSVGENIIFRPSANWRKDAKNEDADPNAVAMKDKLKDKKVKCRICNGEHFTARCPYKDTMAPIGEAGAAAGADVAAGMPDESPAAPGPGGAGAGKKGSYVPPALRGGPGGAAAGERMGGAGGKYGERDDLATLRVTNVSYPTPLLLLGVFCLLTRVRNTGLRDGRRERAARDVRALRPRHARLPGQGQGHGPGQGLRLHQLRGPRGRRQGVQQDGRLGLQASHPARRVREEGRVRGCCLLRLRLLWKAGRGVWARGCLFVTHLFSAAWVGSWAW